MKKILCFLTGLLLIIGTANAQCITMTPSNFEAVVDGNVHNYVIQFSHANLTANALYSLRYEFQYNGETIPDDELGQYIDLDTCNIHTHYSQNVTCGSRITTSVGYFPSNDNPLELGFNISSAALNALYGNYLTDSREDITFSIRWLQTGDYKLKLSLYTMNGGDCHQELAFHGAYYIGASSATLGTEVLNNDIVTPKELNDTVIYICYGEVFTRGDWTVAADYAQWDGTDQNGCDFISEHLVHFYTNDGICNNNRLDSTQKVTLKRRPQFTATLNNGTDDNRLICAGTSAGYVYLTIGGTYANNSTYTVTNGQNTIATGLSAGTAVKVDNLSAGTYNFTVTDGNQCSIDVSGNVEITESQNANTYTINTSKTDVVCNGESTGSITVTGVTPGSNNVTATPYQYKWSNDETTTSIDGLTAGDYTITLTDNMGCTASKAITVTENPAITSSKSIECCYSELPYRYTTQGEDTIFAEAGTKVVKFTSVQGCDSLVTVTLTVNQNPTVTISKDINDNSICANQETATLTATPDGGTGEIQYQWKNGENNVGTNSTYTASVAGSYNIIITDSKGCTATATESITLTENTLPSITASTQDASICAGQQTAEITSVLTDGTAGSTGVTYAWLNGENEISGATASNYVANAAGSYKIAVMDAQGCKDTSEVVTITVNTLPQITASTQDASICAGQQTAEITSVLTAGTAGSTGVTYAWLNGENEISDATASNYVASAAGSYKIAVVDAQGCKDTSAAVVITVNELPSITASTQDASICAGQQTAEITSVLTAGSAGSSDATYAWLKDNSTIASATSDTYTADAAGSYKIAVIDAEGCKDTSDVVTITVNTLPTVAIATNKTDNSICAGQETISLTANVTKGTADFDGSYAWSNQESTQTVEVASASRYHVTVTDVEGCTATADTNIVENTLPSVAISTQTPVVCNGDAATISSNVTAGTAGSTDMEYQWTKDGNDIASATSSTYAATEAGSYSLNIKDAQGCTATATPSVTIAINPLVSLELSSDSTQTICAGSSIQEISISFSNSTVSVVGLPTGISYNDVTNKITGSCNVAGEYRYTVTATSNQEPACDPIVKTGTITVNANPTVEFATSSTTICSGKDYTITPTYTGTATLTYAWYKGSENTVVSTDANLALTNVTATANYHVVVTDGNTPACTATSENFTVTVNTNPTVHIATVAGGTAETSKETCLNEEFTLFAVSTNTASSYQWYKGDNALSGETSSTLSLDATAVAQSGSYTVKLIDNQSTHCEATSEAIVVTVDTLPQPTLASGLSICANSTDFPTALELTTIDGQGLTYEWSLSNSGTYTGSGKTINASWATDGTATASVTVTDGNGCTNNTQTTVTVHALPTAEVGTNDASICLGQQTTSLYTVPATGYSFSWSNGETTNEITVNPSTETTYTVTVTDANGCKAKDSKTVTVNTLPVVTVSADDNSICPNQQEATLTATLTVGNDVTYAWYKGQVANEETVISGQSSSTYTASTAGNYIVEVTDAEGCWATANVEVTENTLPTVTISTDISDNSICAGQGSAVLTANGQGGTGTLVYEWMKGTQTIGSNATYTATAAGTYVVIVTDAQNCTATEDTVIVENELPTVAIAGTVSTNVCKGTEVTISLETSENVASYSWKKGNTEVSTASTYTFTANGDSTYTVTVATANGCTASATYTGHAFALPTITSITPTALTCHGDQTGKVTVAFNGGQPGYTFAWTDGAATPQTLNYTTQSLTDVPAGSYQLTITDNNGCKATSAVVTVTEPDEITGLAATATNAKCFGTNTGSITVTENSVQGGTSPYMYKLMLAGDDDETEVAAYSYNTTFENLYAGTYKVYAKDAHNCSANITKVVTEPDLLTIAESETVANHKNVSCNGLSDGQFIVNVTGGTAPFKYSNNNGTTWSAETSNTSYTFNSLSANSYTVMVKDANNCEATIENAIQISQPAILTVTATPTNLTCNGNQSGKIDLTVTGGTTDYTYSWSGPTSFTSDEDDLTGLAAGTYNVTVTDANQCTATASATLTEPTELTVSIASHTDVKCNGDETGAITLTVGGGTVTSDYTYAWSGGESYSSSSKDIDGLAAGTYTVTVTDDNSCTATASQVISEPTNALAATITAQTNVLCHGASTGSATVTATTGTGTAPYQYKIGNGEYSSTNVFTNLRAGDAVVTVKDNNGCTVDVTVEITEPDQLTINEVTASHRNVNCNGNSTGAITVLAAGGNDESYQYKLNDGSYQQSATFSGLAAATDYVITVKDANGCTATTSEIAITQPTTLAATLTSKSDILCKDSLTGVITVTATTGTGTAPYKYKIDNQAEYGITNTFTALGAGVHTVYVIDDSLCTTSVEVTLVEPATSPAVTATPTDAKCYDGNTGKVVLTMSNGTVGDGYQYKWNDDDFTNVTGNTVTVSDLHAGTYTYQIMDGNGCKTVPAEVVVGQPEELTLTETQDSHTDANCNGNNNGSFVVVAEGGSTPYSYKLGTTEPQATGSYSNLVAGTYNIVVTDAKGCTANTDVTISQPQETTVDLSATETEICLGDSVTLTAEGTTDNEENAYYSWNSNTVSNSGNKVAPQTTTTYTVTFTDGHGCTASDSKTITVNTLPVVEITEINDDVCPNIGTLELTATLTTTTTGDYTYEWNDMTVDPSTATTTSSITNTVTATVPAICGETYTPNVKVTDAKGCTAFDTINVVVNDETDPTILLTDDNNANGVPAIQTGNCVYQVPNVTGLFTVGDNCSSNSYLNAHITQSPAVNTVITQTTPVTVTVTDSCGNFAEKVIAIQVPQGVEIATVSATNEEICVGGNTVLSSIAQNGTEPYTYKWLEGQTELSSTTVSPIITTTYKAVVSDANGCTDTNEIEITVHELPVVSSITTPTDACPFSGSFEVSANATGGSESYTSYAWDGATGTSATATVAEITPVVNGQQYTVKVTVTDSEGCVSAQKSETFTVKDETKPTITGTFSTIQHVNGCEATATASYPALTTVADLNSTFGLEFSDNCTATSDLVVSSSETSTGTCPIVVTRTYTITDKCGNFATVDQTIHVDVADNITVTGGDNDSTVDCASEIVAPHTITPSIMPTVTDACDNELSFDADNIVASELTSCGTTKTYTYTYTDCAQHTKTWTYTYTISNTFNAGAISNGKDTICSGGDGDEIASTTDASGCSTITYEWYSSTNNTNWTPISNSNSATYTPSGLTQTTYFKRLASDECHTATASTGVYTVYVNEDITISSHTEDGSICPGNDYAMEVTATGGIGTLSYQWYADDTAIEGATNRTHTATNINADATYKCVVSGTSASGCETAEESVVVTVFTPETLTLTEDYGATALCPDSAFHFTATAGLSNYAWKVNNTSIDGVTGNTYATVGAGKFVVNATDANGCAVHSDTLDVTRYEAPVGTGWAYVGDDHTTQSSAPKFCKGTEITLVAYSSTANTHIWTCGTDTIANTTTNVALTPAVSATYKVVSVDEHGCISNSTSINVTVDTIPMVTLTGASNTENNVADNLTVCFYDDASLTAASDATVDHWLYGTDSTIAVDNVTFIGSTLTPEEAGQYIVYVKDNNNCIGTDTITFTIRNEVEVTASSNASNGEICLGSDLTLDVTSDDITSFEWAVVGNDNIKRSIQNATTNANAITFAADTTATYVVYGEDASGCPGYDEITVTVNALPTVTVSELANGVICADSAFHFTATSATATAYAWKYNNAILSGETAATLRNTRAGKYVVDVTDDKGCTNHSDTITTTVNALPTITLSEENDLNEICADSAFHFTATSGLNDYTWKLDDAEITGATASTLRATEGGTYTVKAKDDNNCYNTADLTVTVNELPTVVLSEDNSLTTICSDSAFHFTATATSATATDYAWKYNNATLSGETESTLRATEAGKYVVDVVDANGCTNHSDTVETNVNPIPEVTVNKLDISCQNLGSATITNVDEGSFTCSWNGTPAIAMNNPYSATGLTIGWYSYTITNTATNCALIDSVYIDNPGAISATVTAQSADDFTCEGSNYVVEIEIHGGNADYTLEWVNDDQVVADFTSTSRTTTYDFSSLEDGDYDLTLMVTDRDGCTGSTENNFVITIYPSYSIVRDINIATAQTTYTYAGQQYTVPAVPATYYGQTSHGCDSIISYALHQYDLDILIADTCTMTRSSYTKAYKNEPRTLYGDTIYVKTGETAEFFAYIANTDKTTWNDDTVDMSYEVLYSELPIEDENLPNVISALRFSTYYDRSGMYYGLDSVLSAMGEIPANTYAFRENNNCAIQHYDYFYFDAFKNVPNKVEFTPLEDGTYTFKFSAEVRHSGNTGTNWIGIYNPYIVNRRYGHILGGYGDTPSSKDTIAARTFTVIASADGVAPTNAASSISEYSSNASVSTYPNPVRDQLNIRVNGMEGETAITITDAQGKTLRVYNVNLDGSDAVMTYDMNGFAQGMYFINVRNNEKMISQKFILSK